LYGLVGLRLDHPGWPLNPRQPVPANRTTPAVSLPHPVLATAITRRWRRGRYAAASIFRKGKGAWD
jgi:hypothetical protein